MGRSSISAGCPALWMKSCLKISSFSSKDQASTQFFIPKSNANISFHPEWRVLIFSRSRQSSTRIPSGGCRLLCSEKAPGEFFAVKHRLQTLFREATILELFAAQTASIARLAWRCAIRCSDNTERPAVDLHINSPRTLAAAHNK